MPKRGRFDAVVVAPRANVDASAVAACVSSFDDSMVARFANDRARVAARKSFEVSIGDIPSGAVRCVAWFMRLPPSPLPVCPPVVIAGFSPAMLYFAESFVRPSLVAAASVAASESATSVGREVAEDGGELC